MKLHFKMLGMPELFADRAGGRDLLRLRYRKAYAVLAYLAVEHGRWHPRRHLAGFFWPDLPLESAFPNLRQVLKNLNDVLAGIDGAQCLKIERERLGLFFDSSFLVDVQLLEAENLQALRECASADALAQLMSIVDPHLEQLAGAFLAGIDADENGEFEDWLLLKRAFFDRTRSAFFREYVLATSRCGLFEQSLRAVRAWVHCNPVDDEAAQTQMAVLVALDRPLAALDAYADFVQRLEQLIGGVVAVETACLRQRIAETVTLATNEQVAIDACLPDEVRRVVVLQVEPDLSGESELLEPESYLAPLDAALGHALTQWNGQRFLSTGLTLSAVFGLVDDGEQAPRRALRAALDIAALPIFGRARIGVCEGKALICPGAAQALAGSVLPVLAQRLALCGDPGDIIVAESLTGELGSRACFQPLASRHFPGLAGAHIPCRLVSAPGAENDHHLSMCSAPFVGRLDEFIRLSTAIRAVGKENQAAFIEVTGPAGGGKSRLLAELAREHRAAAGEVRWIDHCPELRYVPLGALREALRQRISAMGCSLQSITNQGLDDWLAQFFPEHREALRMPLRAFLASDGDAAVGISGRSQIDALITLLFSPSTRNLPVLLVLDNLHYADEAMRELLQIAMQSPPAAPILAVLTCRPATGVAPVNGVAVTRIALQPLALAESLALIEVIDPDGCISMARRTQLAKMSGGLPLFAEYIARVARNQAVSDASLFGVLQNVLDRLGQDKQMLQAASVFGSSFGAESLSALLPEHKPASVLQRAEALAICVRTGDDTYVFCHDLLRDCAYESIPPKLRRDWHHLAAVWLMQQGDTPAADLAQHFEAASAWREAYDFWGKAAQAAYLSEFSRDAREATIRALAAAEKTQVPVTETERAELELLAGYATLMDKGYGAREAQRFFAPTAAKVAGDLPDETLIRALCGMAAAIPQGRHETLVIMRRLEELASQPAHRMMVCYGYGSLMFWRGEFAESLRYLDEAILIGETLPAREWLCYSADSPVVACRAIKGVNLAFSGAAAAALETSALAVADARSEGRTHGLCFALTMAASVHLVLNQADALEPLAAEGLELATQWNFPLWRGYNTMFGQWAKASQGRLWMRESFKLVSMHREFSAASRLSPVTALWFVGCIFEVTENWVLLDATAGRALALAEKGGDRYCMPDLMRQKAIARQARGDVQGARCWLEQALALAETLGSFGLKERLGRLRNDDEITFRL